MKLTIKIFLLSFFILTITVRLNAQASSKLEGIKEMLNRPLIVELLEPEEDIIASYDKKIGNANKQALIDKYTAQKEAYLGFADRYNEFVQKAASDLLTSHPSIETKKTSEVKELIKSGSKDYTVLYYSPHNTVGSDLYIKTLNYTRIENVKKKRDYSFFMPYTGLDEEGEEMEYGDFLVALKLIKKHIEGIISTGKANYSFTNYAEDQAELNCRERSKFVLNINDLSIQKKETQERLSAAYGNVKLSSKADFLRLIEGDVDELVAVSIPLRIATGSGSQGAVTVSSSNILYTRCILNVATGDIYGATGQRSSAYYNSKDLKKMGACQ